MSGDDTSTPCRKHKPSLNVAMVLTHLILARTTDRRDGSVNKLLQKRLQLWINGEKLFEESHVLQKRIRTKRKLPFDETKDFNRQMNSGKVANALHTLPNEQNGGVLDLQEKINSETVLHILKSKHPSSQPYGPALIVDNWPNTLPVSDGFWKSLGIPSPNSSKNSCKTRDWVTRSNESASLPRVSTNTSRQVSRCSSSQCWGSSSADNW